MLEVEQRSSELTVKPWPCIKHRFNRMFGRTKSAPFGQVVSVVKPLSPSDHNMSPSIKACKMENSKVPIPASQVGTTVIRMLLPSGPRVGELITLTES